MAWILEYRPTILFPGKGFIELEPYPFQQDFINCRDAYRAINKPRQCGISTIVAAEVAFEFDTVPGAQIIILSKDKDSAMQFHSYVTNILKSAHENNPDAPKILRQTQTETTNENGCRIKCFAATKENGRSFTATHLVFDEMAFAPYAEDIWQASSPTLARTNGRATMISTPKGKANLFAQIFEEKDHLGFTTFNYGWWDVPDYNPFYHDMIAATSKLEKDKFIDAARSSDWYKKNKAGKTELAWKQEFEGAFDANVGSVFSTRSLERVFRKNTWMPLQPDYLGLGIVTEHWSAGKQDHRLYATGIDLGRKNDPTEIFTYDITDYDPSDRDENARFNSPARLVDYKHIEAGTASWSEIEMVAIRHLQEWQPDAQHDGTGSSDPFSEAVEGSSEPFMFTKQSKEGIVTLTQHAIDYAAVILPKIPRIYRQHQRYQWDDKDIIQDTVMANGLAIDLFHDGDADIFEGFLKINMSGVPA